MEKEIVQELNELRRDPKGYSNKVAKYKDYFEDDIILRIPGVLHGIRTEEGAAPYVEAAEFLKKANPVCETTPSKGLFAIASDLLKIIQKEDPNNIGNIDMDAIINKYGAFGGDFHRSIEFGGTSGEHTILDLLAGDGDKSRSQREALLNGNLKKVGVASGRHDKCRFVNIILACTQFKNNSGNDDYSL
jgi:hypothetical protein